MAAPPRPGDRFASRRRDRAAVRRLAPAVLVIALLAAAPAEAAKRVAVSLDGTELVLPLPPRTCALDQDHAADRDRLALMRRFNAGRNDVLAVFADCGSLEAFRKDGSTLGGRGGVGVFLAPVAGAQRRHGVSRERFVAAIAQRLGDKRVVAAAGAETRRRAGALDEIPSLAGTVDLGVLHADRDAVFFGMVQDWAVEGAEPRRVVVVTGTTLVRGMAVSVQLSAPYDSAASVADALARQRANLRRLIAAN